jgi:hypothetical protein
MPRHQQTPRDAPLWAQVIDDSTSDEESKLVKRAANVRKRIRRSVVGAAMAGMLIAAGSAAGTGIASAQGLNDHSVSGQDVSNFVTCVAEDNVGNCVKFIRHNWWAIREWFDPPPAS